VDRYLRVLEVERAAPSRAHLSALVQAHLTRVPFENISKLIQRREGQCRLPDVDTWLDNIERFHFGGTCYVNNSNLYRLLQSLGYEARLCGADMSEPDVHLVVIVRIDGRELMVDVGYAAPFFCPLPRDLPRNKVVAFGQDRFVLRPMDADGRSRLDHCRDGARIHGYTVNPEPRPLDHFDDVITDSYTDSSSFMRSLLVVRFWPGRMVRLHNLSVIEASPDAVTVHQLDHRDQIPGTAEQLFGIPAQLTTMAIEGIGEWVDIYE
jgi:arylamine N-acetyltransferase